MFKKDLSNIRIISERIDVDTDIMSAVLACATKRLDLLHENFKVLSFKLGINNTFALRSILSIACGERKEIDNLSEKKNKYFHILDTDLLDSIVFLTKEGAAMRDEHTRFDIKDSSFACQNIYDALKKVFGITKSRNSDKENGWFSDMSASRMKSLGLNNSIDDGDESYNDSNYEPIQEFDLKDLMDVDDPLLSNIGLLVNSCWNDGKALSILSTSIINAEKKYPGSVNPIWEKFPEKGKEILFKKLREIYDGAVEQIAHMEGIIAQKIKENIKYMKALEASKKIEFDSIEEDKEDVMGKLTSKNAQTAYKIGCTYNITGFRELYQQYMLWETCEIITGEDVVVCLCCAEFCHKGHKLMKGNKGRRSRVVCSCGSNTFPDCPVNDKGNPLADIQGSHTLPMTEWSIVNEYTGNKDKLGKKIRDKIGQKALEKAANKKKKIEPLTNAFENASKQFTKLMSPQAPKEESKLAQELKNIVNSDEENDTIGKMEDEIENITNSPGLLNEETK